jgi:hypothetical protein
VPGTAGKLIATMPLLSVRSTASSFSIGAYVASAPRATRRPGSSASAAHSALRQWPAPGRPSLERAAG